MEEQLMAMLLNELTKRISKLESEVERLRAMEVTITIPDKKQSVSMKLFGKPTKELTREERIQYQRYCNYTRIHGGR